MSKFLFWTYFMKVKSEYCMWRLVLEGKKVSFYVCDQHFGSRCCEIVYVNVWNSSSLWCRLQWINHCQTYHTSDGCQSLIVSRREIKAELGWVWSEPELSEVPLANKATLSSCWFFFFSHHKCWHLRGSSCTVEGCDSFMINQGSWLF